MDDVIWLLGDECVVVACTNSGENW